VLGELEVDDIPAELILQHPAREREEPKANVVERVLRNLGADAGWHLRREAEAACMTAGVSESSFAHEFSDASYIEKKRDGKEVRWRIRS
jgi:hypothetical protein